MIQRRLYSNLPKNYILLCHEICIILILLPIILALLPVILTLLSRGFLQPSNLQLLRSGARTGTWHLWRWRHWSSTPNPRVNHWIKHTQPIRLCHTLLYSTLLAKWEKQNETILTIHGQPHIHKRAHHQDWLEKSLNHSPHHDAGLFFDHVFHVWNPTRSENMKEMTLYCIIV